MNFTKEQTEAMCVKYGPQVGPLPAGVDGTQLLWGMVGTESSFGTDCTPRHEPAFDVGGRYGSSPVMVALLAKYGPAAACSYGPLQIMLCNATGASPQDFDTLDQAFQLTLPFLNSRLRRFKPQSLAEIGEIWNAGSIRPDPTYVAKLQSNYVVPMGE